MAEIDHVVVVMLENRSFDHLLGLLSTDPDYPGVRLGDPRFSNPIDPTNPASPRIPVTDDARHGIGVDPPHSHASVLEQLGRWRRTPGHRLSGEPAMDGFVAAYRRKIAGDELGRPVVHWVRILAVAVVLLAGAAMLAALRWAAPLLAGTGAVLVVVEGLVFWGWRRRRALPLRFGPLFTWPVAVVGLVVLLSAPLDAVLGYWPRVGVLGAAALATTVALLLTRRARVDAPPPTDPELARDVMRCLRPERLPVLATLARSFTLCTRWHCSVPGATWPNRNFVHAGTSDGTVDIEVGFYTNPTIYERLTEAGASWHIYRDGLAQVMAFERLLEEDGIGNWYEMDQFAGHVAAGTLPAYSFVEPCHDGPRSNSQHPGNNGSAPPLGGLTDFERGERLLASVYQTLLANRAVFDRTMLVITYDEHGGFYDHVPPPTRFTPPVRTLGEQPRRSVLPRIVGWFVEQPVSRFGFRVLGPRVPAVVVSPLVPPGRDDTLYDHTAIPATVRRLFAPGTAELSHREGTSATLEHLCRLAAPRQDLPDLAHLVQPGVAGPRLTAAAAPATPSPPRDDDFARQLHALANLVERKVTPLVARQPAGSAAASEPGAAAAVPVGSPADNASRLVSRAAEGARRRRPR